MPYETGSTTGWADLKSRCETFLVSNGWTKTGQVLNKGTVYFSLFGDLGDGLRIKGGTGESGGALTGDPSVSGVVSDANSYLGGAIGWPATYHLFAHDNPDCFVCVINYNTSYVQWLTAGSLGKTGNWVGGEYFGGSLSSGIYGVNKEPDMTASYGQLDLSNPVPNGIGIWFGARAISAYQNYGNMWMTCDLDGVAGDWISNVSTGQYSSSYYSPRFSGSEITGDLRASENSAFNNQIILDPVLVAVTRADYKHSLVGSPKHVRHTSVLGLGMADIVSLGADRWMVFPLLIKSVGDGVPTYSTDSSIPTTGLMGFAVKYDGP